MRAVRRMHREFREFDLMGGDFARLGEFLPPLLCGPFDFKLLEKIANFDTVIPGFQDGHLRVASHPLAVGSGDAPAILSQVLGGEEGVGPQARHKARS